MQQKCTVTGKTFEVTEKDLQFYKKLGVPVPTLCPQERQRRRLAWRNEHHLYRRKCDATGRTLISMYDKDFPGNVYDSGYWWSDKWSAKDYRRDFDFNRPFFEQFNELFHEVPQANLRQINSENCAYCNYGFQNKNGYVSFSCVKAQDYYYCDTCTTINNCIDCLRVDESELCYECIDCQKGYELFFSQNCAQCRNSWFLKNCKSCKHCFGCTNLSHKEYWIYNKPYSKKDYEEFMKGFLSGNYSVIQKLVEQFDNFTKTQIHRATRNISVENCTGDYLLNSKNLDHCFEAALSEDCRHSSTFGWVQNCMDVNLAAEGSYLYESIGMDGYECAFDINVANNPQNVWYSMFVYTSKHCFGCCGLRNAKYSIFNKSYSKKDYFALRDEIIAHMKETGEWGEFFPVKYSPFAYNETLAQEYFPMTKEAVLEKGWQWKNKDKSNFKPASYELPDSIQDTSKTICNETLSCEDCQKNYRIIKPELEFYKKMKLPIPRKCFLCRYHDRLGKRNSRHLHDRKCDNCQTEIQTTFAPDRPEKVYCEKCYLNALN